MLGQDWRSNIECVEKLIFATTDLSLDARLLYASNSIVDILGYQPNEVVGKSCWEYFHPDEIPFARAIHGRGVQLDKAAVLNYCQIKNRDGRWVGCECVFTIVHDVMVGCTSIYKNGTTTQRKSLSSNSIYVETNSTKNELLLLPLFASCSPRRHGIHGTICFLTSLINSIKMYDPKSMSPEQHYFSIALVGPPQLCMRRMA